MTTEDDAMRDFVRRLFALDDDDLRFAGRRTHDLLTQTPKPEENDR